VHHRILVSPELAEVIPPKSRVVMLVGDNLVVSQTQFVQVIVVR